MAQTKQMILAGGCFWCMVKPFDQWDGIQEVVVGYTGGHVPNPTYEAVKSGQTGHTEAVLITYDPAVISYEEILAVYWQLIDPTDGGGQFIDRGSSYRPVIYYQSDAERQIAESSRAQIEVSGQYDAPIQVAIEPAGIFYPAEAEHQNYYQKNPEAYRQEYENSGRLAYFNQRNGEK